MHHDKKFFGKNEAISELFMFIENQDTLFEKRKKNLVQRFGRINICGRNIQNNGKRNPIFLY